MRKRLKHKKPEPRSEELQWRDFSPEHLLLEGDEDKVKWRRSCLRRGDNPKRRGVSEHHNEARGSFTVVRSSYKEKYHIMA